MIKVIKGLALHHFLKIKEYYFTINAFQVKYQSKESESFQCQALSILFIVYT